VAAATVTDPKGGLHVFDREGPWPIPEVRDRLPILVYRRIEDS